eukprot:3016833-Rhodomonas_salina.2
MGRGVPVALRRRARIAEGMRRRIAYVVRRIIEEGMRRTTAEGVANKKGGARSGGREGGRKGGEEERERRSSKFIDQYQPWRRAVATCRSPRISSCRGLLPGSTIPDLSTKHCLGAHPISVPHAV